jgi:hypothetical protein
MIYPTFRQIITTDCTNTVLYDICDLFVWVVKALPCSKQSASEGIFECCLSLQDNTCFNQPLSDVEWFEGGLESNHCIKQCH